MLADSFHVTSCCAILCRSQDEIPRVCKRWAQLSESPRLWRNIVISPNALRTGASRQMNVLPWLRRRFGAVQSLVLVKLDVRTLLQSCLLYTLAAAAFDLLCLIWNT